MVFFISNIWPRDFSRGVTKKVFAQINAMEALGHKVKYYSGYIENGAAIFNCKGEIVYLKHIPFTNKYLNQFLKNYYLKAACTEFLNIEIDDLDILYSRYLYFDPLFLSVLKKAKKNNMRTILELHSYPMSFAFRVYEYPVYAIDFFFRKKCLKKIDEIVAISQHKNIWGRSVINIDNGVDLENTKKHNRVNDADNIIRLISVSYEWEVHGYDRVIKGLYEYYQNPDISGKYKIEVIFVGTVMEKTKNLISNLHMESYIKLAGRLSGEKLDNIYDHADIGIGPVGAHRANLLGSGLKTKEYISRGLPFIYSGETLCEKNQFPFALQVESNDNALNMLEIIAFFEKMKQIPSVTNEIREWAKNFTWEKELEKVF